MAPRFRNDLAGVQPYIPGRSIAEVAAAHGLDDVVKLASNESPYPPFDEAQQAIAAGIEGLNRYPDNRRQRLAAALARHHGVGADQIWTGGASNELTLLVGLTLGGPGTSAVYAWPSFGLYRIGTVAAFSTPIEVPLDERRRHDLDALEAAVRGDTTVVFICNPNNPTSTHVTSDDLVRFVDRLPNTVMVVVDEAYGEYATAADYGTMIPLAAERPNVVVTRTFSKVYGLAGLRVGYAITAERNIAELRRLQLPFSVTSLAESAAIVALGQQHRIGVRVERNEAGRKLLVDALRSRGFEVAESQANFAYTDFGERSEAIADALSHRGVIVRPSVEPGWLRISVGTDAEIGRLLSALDDILAAA